MKQSQLSIRKIVSSSLFSTLALATLSMETVSAQEVENPQLPADQQQVQLAESPAPLQATEQEKSLPAEGQDPFQPSEPTYFDGSQITDSSVQQSWEASQPSSIEISEQSDDALLNDPTFEKEGARFSLAILPDTQFYSRYATEGTGNQFDAIYGSEPFNSQTRWIADHDDQYNIQMSLHVGDVVDQSGVAEEWQVADEAISILEQADHNYAMVAGNHDIGGDSYYGHYLNTFSPERAGLNETLVERDPSGAHEYHIYQVDGQDFAVLGLSWGAGQPALDWAQALLDQHPETPTILLSHQLINIDPDSEQAQATAFGEYIWQELINHNDQIYLTVNGHHHGATYTERQNAQGNPVIQLLMDYQMAYMGGNAYMGLLEHDLTHNKIHLTTFSPWVVEKDPDLLVADDQALMRGTNESFTIDFNFAERFPNLSIGQANKSSASQAIRADFIQHFDEPEEVVYQAPAHENDYPEVEGTVAHWRIPTDQIGQVVPVGGVIQDQANPANAFYRAELNQDGIGGAELEHVQIVADAHPLSSNQASIRFTGGSRNVTAGLPYKTASYFRTADGAPINAEEFENGYTFEAFVKFDPDYTVEDNRWMQWLVREGQRENIDNYNGTEGDEPPFAWAMSNLKEVQFSFTDSQLQPNEGSNWSGEIVDLDEWYHLAVVNDPESQTVTMYVNGVPVLRNSIQSVGIANDNNQPWSLGAGQYDGQREAGFIGWLGEIRLVNRPLDQSDWLIARADQLEEQGSQTDRKESNQDSTANTPKDQLEPPTTSQANQDRQDQLAERLAELESILAALGQQTIYNQQGIEKLQAEINQLQDQMDQVQEQRADLDDLIQSVEKLYQDQLNRRVKGIQAEEESKASTDSLADQLADWLKKASQDLGSAQDNRQTGQATDGSQQQAVVEAGEFATVRVSTESTSVSSVEEPSQEQKGVSTTLAKSDLPQTGSTSLALLGMTSVLSGLGLAGANRRKK